MLKHNSIAEIPEPELVAKLAGDAYWRSYITSIKGIPDHSVVCRNCLLKELTKQRQGDVDILVVPVNRPECATAIEVKRIKVGEEALRSQKPNKLNELNKGFRQTNKLAEIGFWQVYLYVLVVVDSRNNNAGRHTFDGLPQTMGSAIQHAITPDALNKRAGLMHYEFVQPMDDAPLGVGSFNASLIRLAEAIGQPKEVTDWVARVVAARRSCF